MYAKDLEKPKYQLLINTREQAGIKNINDPSAFINYSNSMDDIYENIENYNIKKKTKILLVFDEMVNYVLSNKKVQQVLK